MGKLVIKSAKDFREASKAGRDTVNDTARIIRAHAKQLSYADKIERLEKSVGSKVNGILRAFETLNKSVVKRVGKSEITATMLITPQVMQDIMNPYNKFLESFGNSSSVGAVINFLESKRAKELDTYGKTELLRNNINTYFDLSINKYILPLRTIEAQINEMNSTLGYKEHKKITFLSSKRKGIPQAIEIASIESEPIQQGRPMTSSEYEASLK